MDAKEDDWWPERRHGQDARNLHRPLRPGPAREDGARLIWGL